MNTTQWNTDLSIKILGASGGKTPSTQLTSFQISENIFIDAGNILDNSHINPNLIEHIFITHTHLDHLLDIAFLIDNTFELRKESLKIYGQLENLEILHQHIFNWKIWPDFTQINLLDSSKKAIELHPIKIEQPYTIDNTTITPIANNHCASSNGYLVKKQNHTILLTSDTYCCDTIWEKINQDKTISTIIIDVSFPSRMEQLAYNSKHLTPKLLSEELTLLNRDDVTIHICHLKPLYQEEITQEIIQYNLLRNGGKILETHDIIEF